VQNTKTVSSQVLRPRNQKMLSIIQTNPPIPSGETS